MKYIHNNLLYDTEKALSVCRVTHIERFGEGRMDYDKIEVNGILMKTNKGRYFVYCDTEGKERIIPITTYEAKIAIERQATPDERMKAFPNEIKEA